MSQRDQNVLRAGLLNPVLLILWDNGPLLQGCRVPWGTASCDQQNVCRLCQMSPGGQNVPRLRPPALGSEVSHSIFKRLQCFPRWHTGPSKHHGDQRAALGEPPPSRGRTYAPVLITLGGAGRAPGQSWMPKHQTRAGLSQPAAGAHQPASPSWADTWDQVSPRARAGVWSAEAWPPVTFGNWGASPGWLRRPREPGWGAF